MDSSSGGTMDLASRCQGLISGAAGCSLSRLFYFDVLLSPNEDIPHFGDVILHQMFVEVIGDLQPIDEGSSGYALVVVVYQGHLTLKVVNIVFQTLPTFHLDYEKVIVVPLEFSLRSKLVVKCISYFMKIPERIPREGIKSVVGDFLEAEWECSAEKEVIVGVNCHLVLILAKMKEWVGGSQVVIKGLHHKLL